jgi:benzoyl-CoA reductase/2-hydroxyglutaryl-CoA dehydratase subunit BcrC/BadD/HgdB
MSKNLGKLYNGKMATKRREWKGFRDTAYDFWRWLICWGALTKLSLEFPTQLPKALFRYRWMSTYLTVPAYLDKNTMGLRGAELRYCHEAFWSVISHAVGITKNILRGDANLNGNSKKAKAFSNKVVLFDEMMPISIMAGFPNLVGLPAQLISIFLPSMMDQLASMPYIDAIENYGLPADVCPLPAAEAGCAVLGDYPRLGVCFVTSSMPCDGSCMSSSYQDRFFKIPTYPLSPPVRFNDKEVQKYAVKDILDCIKFIEDHTGEKFSWDAYFTVMKRYNEETEFLMKKWEINKTPYPQITGPALTIHRMYAFQIAGSMDPKWVVHDRKVDKMMMKNYELDKKKYGALGTTKHKHRAIVWSCPAHYYVNFSNWALCCWDIQVLLDMECMLSYHIFDTENKEASLVDLATAYERMAMRSATNGGHPNALEELWKQCKEFNADIVIMYGHVSCKTMAGLNGLFEDQARQRGIHLVWVEHDLLDPRTVSRKEMRNKVNRYMQTVFREEPLDKSLLEFDDEKAW